MAPRLIDWLGVLAATLLVAVNIWIAASVFMPVHTDGRVDYVFVPAAGRVLAWAVAGCAAAFWALAQYRQGTGAPSSIRQNPWLGWALAGWALLLLLPLAVLALPHPRAGTALSYVLVDLRWAWLAIALLPWVAPLVSPMLGHLARRPRAVQVIGLLALGIVPVVTAIVTTPHARFGGAMGGDEPKYLRYCENFYQGRGFEISGKRLITDAAAAPDVAGNVRAFVRAVGEEAPLLVADVRRALGVSLPPRLVGGEPGPGLFFDGKHAGHVYQLHNPGLSFILFPAYYVDRRWTGSGVGYQEEFPESLPATNAMLLLLYAGYGLSMFLLLRRVSVSAPMAWVLSFLVVLVLPVGSFAFQIYPEVAAGIVLCLVAARLVSHRGTRTWLDVGAGLLSSFLPWLHVRFGLATVLLALWALSQSDRPWRVRIGFLGGAAAGLMALSAYTYRLTGSIVPLSTYGADAPLSPARLAHGLPGFAFDNTWGLFPHAPIFLLAIPGITLLWRRRRGLAVPALLLIAAVLAPAAAHGYWAAGATPARYLVAAVPFIAIFLVESTTQWSRHKAFMATWILLAAISLETAIRYDLHHRDLGKLIASGFSGWRPNLLFPSLGTDWRLAPTDWLLFASWIAVLLVLLSLPWWRPMRTAAEHSGAAMPAPRHVLLCALALVVVAVPAAAVTGRRWSADYQPAWDEVRERAFRAVARQVNCRMCYSARSGWRDPTSVFSNYIGTLAVQVESASPTAGQPSRIRIRARIAEGAGVLGDLLVDLGDGTTRSYPGHFGDVRVEHVYAQPGEYRVRATLRARGDGLEHAEATVSVGGEAGSAVK